MLPILKYISQWLRTLIWGSPDTSMKTEGATEHAKNMTISEHLVCFVPHAGFAEVCKMLLVKGTVNGQENDASHRYVLQPKSYSRIP